MMSTSLRLLARRTFSSEVPAGTMTHRNLGNNVVVGGTIFDFVGGVYWYTVHNLRKQGGQLEEDLDELAGEIEVEQSKQQSPQ